MSSPYQGQDKFTDTLSLMTDGDPPMAMVFRLPNERLLDNDVHLKTRLDALAASGVSYTPATPSDWPNPDPTNVAAALDATRSATHRLLAIAALRLRPIECVTGALGGTSDVLCAVSVTSTEDFATILAIKEGTRGVNQINDAPTCTGTTIAELTTAVYAAARNPSSEVIVAVGDGGNDCATSSNGGSAWFAGGSVGAVCKSLVYSAGGSNRFVAVTDSNANAYRSGDDGATWSSASTELDDCRGGIAAFDTGNLIACGPDASAGAGPRFSGSLLATTWTLAVGTVPDAASYVDAGSVAGRGDAYIWHAGLISGAIRICRTTQPVAWEHIATIQAPSLARAFNSAPKLLCCKDTGMLVVVAPCATDNLDQAIYASFDGGFTWTDPLVFLRYARDAFAVAGGRLLATRGARIFASDGIGWK